jgi:hypothetical protein
MRNPSGIPDFKSGSIKLTLVLLTCLLSGLAFAQNGHGIQLTWTQAPSLTTATGTVTVVGNNVYRGTLASGPFTEIYQSCPAPCTKSNPITSWLDQTGVAGTTYFYAVTAVGSNGIESAQDVDITSVVYPSILQPPSNLQVQQAGNHIQLRWVTPKAAASVSIWRGDHPTLPAPSKIATVTTSSYVDSPHSGTYYYEAKANYVVNNRPVVSAPSNIVGPVRQP